MRGVEVATAVAEFRVLSAPAAEPPLRARVPAEAVRVVPPEPVPPPAATVPAVPGPAPLAAVQPPDAHRFVLSTLRPLFEVLDRRRPARHLTAIATDTVVDVLRTLSDRVPRAATVTGWGRVHVCPAAAGPPDPGASTPPDPGASTPPDPGGSMLPGSGASMPPGSGASIPPGRCAEIHLTYHRGARVLAAAGRVEYTGDQWRWVAFTTAL